MPRPLIAVPAYPVKAGRVQGWEKPGVAAPTPYMEALHRAGAREAILMPVAIDDTDAGEVLERFDGLLLMGGGDLHPEEYGQERRDEVYGVIPHRDRFEVALARAAVARDLPTLAICRGHQVLNVALGGSLDQHISERDGVLAHGKPGAPGGSSVHDVDLEPGSRLAEAMGVTRASCSSHHHQAVDRVGDRLHVTARSPDGVVEGIELDGDAWIVGAQWHPEDTAATDAAQQRLFDTFVRQAARG
ncbi:MAG TPA: gamma-glutamyl-gamma-aminobutyrate hydrolase family protein [Acidimicrobiia bacterium]|nr:gamma-glutamyl-gamma-aminobutyrate hydrolase family protein [Acidimicrobiia bacterium]